ncbi:MAG: hypothetical protein PF961_19745 [Planctomycetota bacterium]|jgi:hypothetical protein|nr:hypothetical protein [Planctomycetota bacterium]
MTRLIVLCCALACANLLTPGSSAAAESITVQVYQADGDPLLFVELTEPVNGLRYQADLLGEHSPVRLSASLDTTSDSKPDASLLYSVTISSVDAHGQAQRHLLGRWPASTPLADGQIISISDLDPAQRWRGTQHHTSIAVEAATETLATRWNTAYRAELERRCRILPDHELELLLHQRFFGSLPERRERNRDTDDLIAFLTSIAGIDDLRDAIPAGDDGHLHPEAATEAAPEAILLPRVDAPATAVAAAPDDAAWYVPRSCAILSFSSLASLRHQTQQLGELLDQWSPGTWGAPACTILLTQLDRLGLDAETCAALEADGPLAVSVAGWDPFFAAGSNLLVVLRGSPPLQAPADAPFSASFEDQRVLLLSTGERLLSMAQAARGHERSLAHDVHYAAARARLAARDDATEQVFAYLSDYWLTNFISPRWRILDGRRRTVDARIQWVELLRLAQGAESRSDQPIGLDQLAADAYLEPAFRDWLLDELELNEQGVVIHRSLGGIGAHPAIDELPFELVTATERADYERFRNIYQNRWRQMDPIAWQLERVDGAHWRSRLYVSPIGRQSDWSSLRGFVLSNKIKQPTITGPPLAAGISLTINTAQIAPMLGGMQIPLAVTLHALSLDFAPTSFQPKHWLDPEPQQDQMSWLRMPAALVAPRLVFERLSPMVLGPNPGMELESGILDLGEDFGIPGHPLLAWIPENDGVVALAAQPAALRALRDNAAQAALTQQEDPVSSDLHAFVDLQAGYLLRRKLWQMAVQNRSLADWRRRSRLARIAADLGLANPEQIKQNWHDRHVLPVATIPAAVPEHSLSALLEPGRSGGYSYASSAARQFNALPVQLLDLLRLDAYVSVEPQALLFEAHLQFASDPEAEAEAADDEAAEPGTTTLDFDR